MTEIKINDQVLRDAASEGNDAFVKAFVDAIYDHIGGPLTAETMAMLNANQITLLAFQIVHDEVMDGGFVQLIHNGYGPFIFKNPFAKSLRTWGMKDMAKLINKAHDPYRDNHEEIEKECSDEEFMALFERYPKFDDLDDLFIENEEEWVSEVAHFIDEHIEQFATITE